MSIIKESRKKDFEDKIFKVINRNSEDILFLLIYKINYFIEFFGFFTNMEYYLT